MTTTDDREWAERCVVAQMAVGKALETVGMVTPGGQHSQTLETVLQEWIIDDATENVEALEEHDGIDTDVKWRGINLAAGLTQPGCFSEYPDSVREIRRAALTMLAQIADGIAEAYGGGCIETAFNIPYIRVAGVERAYRELGAAIEQLKADACATVKR